MLKQLDSKQARIQHISQQKDIRRKIQLGELVIKAGLQNEETAVLLGILLEASEFLKSNEPDEMRRQWKSKSNFAIT